MPIESPHSMSPSISVVLPAYSVPITIKRTCWSSSTLQGPSGDARDDIPLGEEEQQDQRRGGDHDRGRYQRQLGGVLGVELEEPRRHWLDRARRQEDDRVDDVVPNPDGHDEPDHSERRLDERHDDL